MSKKLTIKIDGDVSGYKDKVGEVNKSNKKMGLQLKHVAAGAAVGFALLTGAVAASISAYRTQEQAEIKTRATIKATGQAAGLTAEEIFKMASALQDVTTFGDETIISGQNMLLTFKNIGGEVFPRATEAMLDMATAMGTGLKENAIQLGKALNDPIAGISALSRVGITFSDEQKNTIKTMQKMGDVAGAQGIILTELESQFGGVARASAQGTGAFTQLSNVAGDIVEDFGRDLAPTFINVALALKEMLKEFQASDNFITTAVRYWGDVIGGMFDSDASKKGLDEITENLQGVESKIDEIEKRRVKLGENTIYNSFIGLAKKDNEQYAELLFQRSELMEAQKAKELEIEERAASEKSAMLFEANAEERAKKKEAIEAMKEAQKESARKEFEEKAQMLVDDNSILTELELEKLQERIDAKAEQDAIAKAQELEANGQHLLAMQKLEDLAYKKKVKASKEAMAKKKKDDKLDKKIKDDIAKLDENRRQGNIRGTELMLNSLASLSQSGNKTLGRIAKVAGIARTIMNTAQGVTNALAQVPYPLNIPAAASVGLAGAVQLATIKSQKFNKGGMYSGGVIGVDSLPSTLQHGELVAPVQNFEEVIGSVRAKREAEEQGLNTSGPVNVIVSYDSVEASRIVTASQVENSSLGVNADSLRSA